MVTAVNTASIEDIKLSLSENGLELEHLSDELRSDKEVVLLAVNNNGYSLKYASDDLKNDIYGDEIPIHELPLEGSK